MGLGYGFRMFFDFCNIVFMGKYIVSKIVNLEVGFWDRVYL